MNTKCKNLNVNVNIFPKKIHEMTFSRNHNLHKNYVCTSNKDYFIKLFFASKFYKLVSAKNI